MLGMPTPSPTAGPAAMPSMMNEANTFISTWPAVIATKQSQREAERADEERYELDRGDQPQQPPGRAVRDEKREEMQAVAPETDDQDDREAQDREKTGDREVARHGEGMQAEQAEGHEADHVQHQDEHEQREDIGRIFAAFGADIGVHHAGNEAGEALDGDLPATGNELALHPADHKDPQEQAGDHHPHRAGGKGNLMIADMEHVEHLLHLELVHRVHFALIRHAIPRLKILSVRLFGPNVRNPKYIPEGDGYSKEQHRQQAPGRRAGEMVDRQPTSAPPPIPPSNSAKTRLPSL